MKKKLISTILAIVTALLSAPVMNVSAASATPMYRMYNFRSGEHFYTSNTNERDHLIVEKWQYEGIGWTAPSQGAPVYRLYNPVAGDHHYTTNVAERDNLIRHGWRSEGIGWRSGGRTPIYREYNPNAATGTHNYTISKNEDISLARSGWRSEGIGWYGTTAPARGATNVPDGLYIVGLCDYDHMSQTYFEREPYANEIVYYGDTNSIKISGVMEKEYSLGSERTYTFELANDCVFCFEPRDVAPITILSEDNFFLDVFQSYPSQSGAEYMGLKVQNGRVYYAYLT